MSTWNVKGKYAIVTGAGSVFADISLRPEAKETIAKFPYPPAEGAQSAVFHQLDQSDWSQISATWQFALDTFGRVDLLCPGAGIWEPPESAFWHPPGISPLGKDDPNGAPGVYHIFAVNVLGPIRFAQIAIDYWLQNKISGNLILVSSQSAYLPTIGTPLYNSTKGALASFGLSLAQMKPRLNIRVNTMCPSTTFTPAVLKEYCKGKVREIDMNMTATECAEVMLRLVTEAEFGEGQVVEAMQCGTKQKSDVKVRVVPYQNLLPPIDFSSDFAGKNIFVEEEKLWEQLKTKGMRR